MATPERPAPACRFPPASLPAARSYRDDVTDTFFITGNAEADALLGRDPLALLLGMLFDQQVPMEWAFASPAKLRARLGDLDANAIAAMDQDAFVAVCCENLRSVQSRLSSGTVLCDFSPYRRSDEQ